jgi:hypothetical protein
VEIAFVAEKSSIKEEDLAFQAEAVDIQMRRDFAPAWGFEAWPVSGYKTVQGIRTDLYHPIWYNDNIGLDALGYHDDQLSGVDFIFGRVLTPPDPFDATTASHEAVEMRADPKIDRWAPMADGRDVAQETGDPVESDDYIIPVTIGGRTRMIAVSNFVLPSYFQLGSSGPWDFLGRLNGPAPAMTPGGYLIVRDPKTGEISYVFADRSAGRRFAMKRNDLASRTGRRLAKVAAARR